nr:hypothetical protein [Tanacetum cinerariifolium]
DSDFYDGYEDQVVDLHSALKEYRDFMLSMSAKEGVKVPITHAQPFTTSAPSPIELQNATPTPHDTPPQYQPLTPHDSPLQDQPTTPHDYPLPLLTTLMETCATRSQKVAELEKDKKSQALKILQLNKRVKRIERKQKSKTTGLKRLRRVDAAQRGRTNLNAASKGVSAVIALELVSTAKPTMFDDEDVTMTMGQTLIKLKAEKARILDEKIAQKLHDEEVQKAVARDEQERADMEKALELQRQLDKR